MGEKINACRALVAKLGGKSLHGILTCGRESNITIYLKEIGWKGFDWANLVQGRERWWALVKTEMNYRVP
jgi:hypothetical protein